jgi:hypothetical protein
MKRLAVEEVDEGNRREGFAAVAEESLQQDQTLTKEIPFLLAAGGLGLVREVGALVRDFAAVEIDERLVEDFKSQEGLPAYQDPWRFARETS